MRNTPLLEATMQKIVDHPELHNQRVFFAETDCGTAGCFAGWTCMLSGFREQKGTTFPVAYKPGTWDRGTPAAVAKDLLGLTQEEATTLFLPGNTRSMLQLMVKDLVNGDSLRDDEFYRQETYRAIA